MSRSRKIYVAASLVILILAMRLLWIAGHLETGFETLTAMLRHSTLSWLGLEWPSNSNREPTDQADFWLVETERIIREPPASSKLLLGAAWLLDSPGISHFSRHFETVSVTGLPPLGQVGVDFEEIQRNEDLFEAKCAARCLDLAQHAARREPSNSLGWRSVALLAQRASIGSDPVPRVSDPIKIWQECAAHDPDNALYDYLAALHLWPQAGRLDIDEDTAEVVLVVSDKQRFAEVVRHLEVGQKKSAISIGELAFPAVVDFLAESSLPRSEQAEIALDRRLSFRGSTVLLSIWRLQQTRAKERVQAGDLVAASLLYRQCLRMAEQAMAAKEALAFEAWLPQFSQAILAELESIATAEDKPALQRQKAANESAEQLIYAIGVVSAKTEMRFKPKDFVEKSLPANLALQTSLLLGTLAVVFLSVARLLSARHRDDMARLGLVRHVDVWFLMLALTVLMVGAMPAGLFSVMARRRATAMIVIAVEFSFVVMAAYGLLRWLRRRNYQWSVRDLAIAIAAFAVLFTLLPVFIHVLSPLHDPMLDILPAGRGLGNVSGATLRNALQFPEGEWRWALVQWAAYGGPTLTAAGALVLVAIWYAWRSARTLQISNFRFWRSLDRSRIGGMFRTAGDSALWAGVCCLIFWLCVAPMLLRAMEAWHQDRMDYLRDPPQYWTELKAAAAAELLPE